MDKIASFGAYYVNGSPGYPFKWTTSSAAPAAQKAVPTKGLAAE
jgi:hypothetical protein